MKFKRYFDINLPLTDPRKSKYWDYCSLDYKMFALDYFKIPSIKRISKLTEVR